jgi:hypothetical protein
LETPGVYQFGVGLTLRCSVIVMQNSVNGLLAWSVMPIPLDGNAIALQMSLAPIQQLGHSDVFHISHPADKAARQTGLNWFVLTNQSCDPRLAA